MEIDLKYKRIACKIYIVLRCWIFRRPDGSVCGIRWTKMYYYPIMYHNRYYFQGKVVVTVNSSMENHRQWRITRKDIAEFLEI